jgi:CheY-like chemotaxis protein
VNSDSPCATADAPPCVLLVESEPETREVLTTVLQLRGLRIYQADEPQKGLQLAGEARPDVIVLDFDEHDVDDQLESEFAARTRQPHGGVIVLGSTPPARQACRNRFIAKPFHYGPLVQTIERLVGKAA